MSQSVTLPWPSRELSPNARVHWAALSRAKRTASDEAWALCKQAKLTAPSGAPHVHLEICPPDARARDMDNVVAAMKAALDGVSQAIGVDDSKFTLSQVWGPITRPHGQVVVTLTAEGYTQIPFLAVIS